MKAKHLVFLSALAVLLSASSASAQDGVTKYVRYSYQGRDAYGILENETRDVSLPLDGSISCSGWQQSGRDGAPKPR